MPRSKSMAVVSQITTHDIELAPSHMVPQRSRDVLRNKPPVARCRSSAATGRSEAVGLSNLQRHPGRQRKPDVRRNGPYVSPDRATEPEWSTAILSPPSWVLGVRDVRRRHHRGERLD